MSAPMTVGPNVAANALEATCKAAYEKWAYRVGVQAAWEYLPSSHRLAWEEVVCLIQDGPECKRCGEMLLCTSCNADDIYSCPTCGEALDCQDEDCPGMAGEDVES